MSVKEKETGFREILTNIRGKKFSPFYLLQGEEAYYIDELVKALEENVVAEEDKDFNLITFYGADSEISNVIASAQQFPVMADYQLVLLKEAQTMMNSKSQLEKLTSYLSNPNKTTVLAVTYKSEGLPATHPLIKQFKTSKEGILFKSDKLKDYQIKDPVKDYCTAKGVAIDEKSLTLLCEYIGGPLSKIFGEIDKLIIAGGGKSKRIDSELIERNIGISKDYNTFELVNSIGRKDFSKCMRIVKHFSNNPKQNPGVITSAVLFNYFSKLLIACMCKDKSDTGLMKELELKNSYALRDFKDGMKFYNSKSALRAVHFIRDFDVKSKGVGSYQNEYELMRELVFNIITA